MPEAPAHVGSGKVRELYALDDERLLLVASDRVSTFDVVLPTEIPDKGRVLTGLSAFWFARTRELCPNHLLYWSIIETAIAAGCEVLDFGRSTPNEGTYKFKEQWGAEPLTLHWEYWLAERTPMPNASPFAGWIRPAVARTI